jgi:hypothetical protein
MWGRPGIGALYVPVETVDREHCEMEESPPPPRPPPPVKLYRVNLVAGGKHTPHVDALLLNSSLAEG